MLGKSFSSFTTVTPDGESSPGPESALTYHSQDDSVSGLDIFSTLAAPQFGPEATLTFKKKHTLKLARKNQEKAYVLKASAMTLLLLAFLCVTLQRLRAKTLRSATPGEIQEATELVT